MLKLKNVSKYYHSNEVVALGLRKINLNFELGEFIAVTGESGSGKSTLLNVISGLDTYEDGEMFVNGEETSYFSVADWEGYRRQNIGFVFQNYNIVDSYSVLENVMVALRIQGYDKHTRKERALELIRKVGLESHVHHKASKLSGGQKQRAVIARALAKDCPIIVCDEPTGNLDSESSKNVMELLQEIAHDKLVIVVTHNYDEVQEYATRKIRLFDGEVVEDKKIRAHEIVEAKQSIPSYIMNISNLLAISIKNLFTTPRRTIFTSLVFIFITTVFTLIYGFFVSVTSEAGGSEYNAIFQNVTENRIIVTKFDETVFTPEELLAISNVNRVIDVYEHDIVNDSTINMFVTYDEREWSWIDTNPMFVNPSIVLQDIDLSEGRLPTSEFEVVIENNKDIQVGETIYLGYGYIYYDKELNTDTTMQEEIEANSIPFEVVGLVSPTRMYSWQGMAYFHEDFLNNPMVISNAYVGGDWSSPVQINLNYELEVVDHLSHYRFEIDEDLVSGEIVVPQYIVDNLHWFMSEKDPLIDPESNPDFYKDISFVLNAYSSFHDSAIDVNIIDYYEYGDKRAETIYLSEEDYNQLFNTDIYQITAYVRDSFDADGVKRGIEDLGFNAIYPRNVEDPFTALGRIVLSIVFGGLMLLLMVIVYFLTFLVLRNIQESKKKDFLIFRSIGASKSSLNKITNIELLISTVFSIVFVFALLYLNSTFKTVKWLANLLNYYSVGNYVFLFILLLLLTLLLGKTFNSRIFNKSVITSLKAE